MVWRLELLQLVVDRVKMRTFVSTVVNIMFLSQERYFLTIWHYFFAKEFGEQLWLFDRCCTYIWATTSLSRRTPSCAVICFQFQQSCAPVLCHCDIHPRCMKDYFFLCVLAVCNARNPMFRLSSLVIYVSDLVVHVLGIFKVNWVHFAHWWIFVELQWPPRKVITGLV